MTCCALSWLRYIIRFATEAQGICGTTVLVPISSCDVDIELIQSKPLLFLLGTNPEIHCGTAKVEDEEDDEEKDEEGEKKNHMLFLQGKRMLRLKILLQISQSRSVLLCHNAGALEVKRRGGINTKK